MYYVTGRIINIKLSPEDNAAQAINLENVCNLISITSHFVILLISVGVLSALNRIVFGRKL